MANKVSQNGYKFIIDENGQLCPDIKANAKGINSITSTTKKVIMEVQERRNEKGMSL